MSIDVDAFASAGSLSQAARARMRELAALSLGNPSSVHQEGRAARKFLREARAELAAVFGADPDEVVFTSGTTEALHLGARGLWLPERPNGAWISAYDHAALRSAVASLPGCLLREFTTDPSGVPLDPKWGSADTGLIATALVNHETGMRVSVDALTRAATATGAPLIIDAAQAPTEIAALWQRSAVTAVACSAHKLGGPTGVGALLLRKGTPFVATLRGGAQEHELRAGTEAVVAIAGFTRAAAVWARDAALNAEHLAALQRLFEAELGTLGAVKIVAAERVRAPSVTAFYAVGVPARSLVEALSRRGVFASSGAACASQSNEPSNVMRALGLSRERALEVVRVSYAPSLSEGDVRAVAQAVTQEVRRLRGEAHAA